MAPMLRVERQGPVCLIGFDRHDRRNAINDQLIREFAAALNGLDDDVTVLVVDGGPEYFCFGADFDALAEHGADTAAHRPGELFDIWRRLASGPFVSIAHVRGKVNAGGIGFVAACDIVIADESAAFSLSEMLFGLLPACVYPYLARRVGAQRAHYMTLTAKTFDATTMCAWGLVDAVGGDTAGMLRSHLVACRRLSRKAIVRHKRYVDMLASAPGDVRSLAVAANFETFTDPENIRSVRRFVADGTFPWETS
jgi:polyketide biosynthesis enoyl-CoA hydratase PksH